MAQKKVKQVKQKENKGKDTSGRPSAEELAKIKAAAAAKKKANADAMKVKAKGGKGDAPQGNPSKGEAVLKEDAAPKIPKEAKAPKVKKNATAPAGDDTIAALDIRVGRIVKVWEVEGSDKLFGEEIDVGEEKPRQILSGLRQFYSLDQMMDRKILVICNLKSRKLNGVPSHGMVFCAKSEAGDKVEFVDPPASCEPGELVTFEGVPGEPISAAQVAKRKVLEKCFPDLKTNASKEATWKSVPFGTTHGVCTVPNLADAYIA